MPRLPEIEPNQSGVITLDTMRKYVDAIVSRYLLHLGFRPPQLQESVYGTQRIFQSSQFKNFLQITADKRGKQTLKASKELIKHFLGILNETDQPIHYLFKNMHNVTYLTDLSQLNNSLMNSHEYIVCCFDQSESLFLIDCFGKQLFEVWPYYPNHPKSTLIDEIERRINLGPAVVEIPIHSFPRHENVFAFVTLLFILFDAEGCAPKHAETKTSLYTLQNVKFYDDIVFQVVLQSNLKSNRQILMDALETGDPNTWIDGQTYIGEVNGENVPVKRWFNSTGDIPGEILDLESPYWKRCQLKDDRTRDPGSNEDELMHYTLHHLEDGDFYLEPDWSPYPYKSSNTTNPSSPTPNSGFNTTSPRYRRFLNTYYKNTHTNNDQKNKLCCGFWSLTADHDGKYKENDRSAIINTNNGRLQEMRWTKKSFVPAQNVASDTGAVLPKIREPLQQPGGKLVHCGILFMQDPANQSKWKMDLGPPTEEQPGYIAVNTPLGTRYFKRKNYDLM